MAYKQNSTDLDNILALTSDWNFTEYGALYASGLNLFGLPQLTNSWVHLNSPNLLPGSYGWYSVASNGQTTLALSASKNLYVWGYNGVGEAGLRYTSSSWTWIPPTLLSDESYLCISASYVSPYGTCYAIRSDGTLWSWGDNGYGQLGKGNTTSYSSPVQVGTDTTWTFVTSNFGVFAALKTTSNRLYTCGYNGYGQLGRGTIVSVSSPVIVGTTTSWLSVACGKEHMAGVKSDGTLWTWGRNTSGQLGLGDVNHRSSPVQVGSATDWRKVFCGDDYTIGIRNAAGWAEAFGNNSNGQLGRGNTTSYSSPVLIGNTPLGGWSKISCGTNHTLWLSASNELYGCGDSTNGKLASYVYSPLSLHSSVLDMCATSDNTFWISYERSENAP